MYAIYGLPFTINIPQMLAYIYHTTGSVMGNIMCHVHVARCFLTVIGRIHRGIDGMELLSLSAHHHQCRAATRRVERWWVREWQRFWEFLGRWVSQIINDYVDTPGYYCSNMFNYIAIPHHSWHTWFIQHNSRGAHEFGAKSGWMLPLEFAATTMNPRSPWGVLNCWRLYWTAIFQHKNDMFEGLKINSG